MTFLKLDTYLTDRHGIVRLGGLAGIIGGGLWMGMIIAYWLTHSPTMVDQQGYLWGLTWYDYTKFSIVPYLLFVLGLVSIYRPYRQRLGWLGGVGFGLAVLALMVVTVATVLSLWPQPWGSYAGMDWQAEPTRTAGIALFLGTFPLALGFILLGVAVIRMRTWPRWMGMLLILGPLTIVPWITMNYSFVFGLSWIFIGYELVTWTGPRTDADQTKSKVKVPGSVRNTAAE